MICGFASGVLVTTSPSSLGGDARQDALAPGPNSAAFNLQKYCRQPWKRHGNFACGNVAFQRWPTTLETAEELVNGVVGPGSDCT